MRNLIILLVAFVCVSALSHAHASNKDGWERKRYHQPDRFERAERNDRPVRTERRDPTTERRVRENIRYENNENRRSGWNSRDDVRQSNTPTYDRYRDQNR